VLCNDFYNPVNLARDAATLDIISEGRFELGLGTGWYAGDYQATGIPLESPGTRISRLQESIQILNQAFRGEAFSFEGRFFKIEEFQLAGLPIQKPRPPLMLGGGGKRILSYAAREADIISFNPISTREGGIDSATATSKSTTEKATWVKEAAGSQRDPELSTHFLQLQITNTRAEREAAVDTLLRDWELTEAMTHEDLIESPHYLIGSENELIEKLLRLREQFGITYFVFRGSMETSAQLIKRLKT
jgi:probable F420-dependent oxidoreductase